MKITFEDRLSDSPYVERVWRSYSESGGLFTSIAATHPMMVIEKLQGKLKLFVRGPETKASIADCPADGEWLGIIFKFGTFMPKFPTCKLVDGDVNLPEASQRSFWLHGSTWQFPSYENADTFVERLVRQNLLVCEPAVNRLVNGQPNDLSLRSAQRHFMRATGLTHSDARQIERARYATILLRQGVSILDTVYEAGYFDQAHLTKSLRRFIGQTPAQLMDQHSPEQLSFLYNTTVFC
ncbi:MAG: helix-turn-helix domain-containing protein [Chloroflexota bacterium]